MSDSEVILRFLEGIGLEARAAAVEGPTVVPGIRVDRGIILYDPERMKYPGDLLHEAGHIAFTPRAARPLLGEHLDTGAGEEMAAIAWSYAAAVHLAIDPAIVFHNDGYRGSSPALIANFNERRYVGVSLLQWAEMTTGAMFPKMEKWLRD